MITLQSRKKIIISKSCTIADCEWTKINFLKQTLGKNHIFNYCFFVILYNVVIILCFSMMSQNYLLEFTFILLVLEVYFCRHLFILLRILCKLVILSSLIKQIEKNCLMFSSVNTVMINHEFVNFQKKSSLPNRKFCYIVYFEWYSRLQCIIKLLLGSKVHKKNIFYW